MLNRIHVLQLLEESTKEYIRALNSNDLDFAEYKAEIMAYMKVLNEESLINKYKYMNINKAKELLIDIKK